jgi:NADPH:quinone reductase-like Zn-dependent oxidoreductase
VWSQVVGVVSAVGDKVTTVKPGDTVGYGPQRGSCESCGYCHDRLENVCGEFAGLYDPHYGGYATSITVRAGATPMGGGVVAQPSWRGERVHALNRHRPLLARLARAPPPPRASIARLCTLAAAASGAALRRVVFACRRAQVNERFTFPIPAGIPLDAAGPLLCAGVTTFAPLQVRQRRRVKHRGGQGEEGEEAMIAPWWP